MTTHQRKLTAAIAAIDALFGDTSVSKRQTCESLAEVISHANIMIDALKEDLKSEEK